MVDAKGMTLYYTTRDTAGKSNITGATLANWPVFYTSNIVIPSALNASDFGTITRADGKMQTTYKGWPLYYFINDKSPGDTLGQGLAGVWFAVVPASIPPAPTATPVPTATPTPTPTATATATSTPQGTTVNLSAKNIAFDKSTITVPAGAAITVIFNNQDTGIPHNFAVYTDSSGQTMIFSGQIVTGPATVTYTFTAPKTPGTYFFRCDVHPTQMTGKFIVQ